MVVSGRDAPEVPAHAAGDRAADRDGSDLPAPPQKPGPQLALTPEKNVFGIPLEAMRAKKPSHGRKIYIRYMRFAIFTF